jgi:hypothetical protein
MHRGVNTILSVKTWGDEPAKKEIRVTDSNSQSNLHIEPSRVSVKQEICFHVIGRFFSLYQTVYCTVPYRRYNFFKGRLPEEQIQALLWPWIYRNVLLSALPYKLAKDQITDSCSLLLNLGVRYFV